MAEHSDDESPWWKRILMRPKRLLLKVDDRVHVVIQNRSERRLTYKVKTTRLHSVFPNRTHGFVEAGRDMPAFVLYRPTGTDHPLGKSDHLTIAMKPVDQEITDARKAWNENGEQNIRKFRIDLRDAKRRRLIPGTKLRYKF